MSGGETPALLAAAAGVGFGHAILPDHWVPLAVLGRTNNYPVRRVARLSGLAGVAHVLVSLVLGGVIIAIGLQLRGTVQSAQSTIVGTVLILTGAGFAAVELARARHRHGGANRDHAHGHAHHHDHLHRAGAADALASDGRSARRLGAIMVPFGAAASPDLTILPVFLAASAAGTLAAVGALVVFSAVTIGTIVGLTVSASLGGARIRARWLDRWGNAFSAAVLVAIGVFVLAGG
jgi:hypothetical protein